jgi:hypothetical protein
VITVGRISPANANSGGTIKLSPAMNTIGMANPTTPLMNPAQHPTPIATIQFHCDILLTIKSIMGLYHRQFGAVRANNQVYREIFEQI